jgi:hypothetical protein
MMHSVVQRWLCEHIALGYITVPTARLPEMVPLLGPWGFYPSHTEYDRYGVGRHETVLIWNRQGAARTVMLD